MHPQSPVRLFGNLVSLGVRMTFSAEDYRSRLRGHLGSMWRGAFGHQLFAMCCPFRQAQCNKCPEHSYCTYAALFQPTGNEPGFMQPPPPWTSKIDIGDDKHSMQVTLVLIGSVNREISTVVEAFRRAGESGLGSRKLPATLTKIELCEHNNGDRWVSVHAAQLRDAPRAYPLSEIVTVTSPSTPWRISTTSPIRIKSRPGYDIWSCAMLSLAQRLSLWNKYCGGVRLDKEQWKLCREFLSRTYKLYDHNKPCTWQRYSQRQHRMVPVTGWTGNVGFAPPEHLMEPWWQWWQLAEKFHLGKGCNMGLGTIKLRSAYLTEHN